MSNTKYKTQIVSAAGNFPLEYIPFSIPSINRAIGSPGVLRGRAHMLLGKPETGKTSLTSDLISNAQKLDDKRTMYADIECKFMPHYAQTLGVDLSRLDMVYPDNAEQCCDILINAARSGDYNILVLDSVPQLLPEGEINKSFTENENIRGNALVLRRLISHIVPALFRTNTTLVLINQLRANQSTLSRKETKPYGPFFLQHASTLIMELTYVGKENDAKEIKLEVTRNGQSGKHDMAQYVLFHGRGFDVAGDILTLAIEYGIVEETSKGRFVYNNVKAHGRDNALSTYPIDEIGQKVQQLLNTGSADG